VPSKLFLLLIAGLALLAGAPAAADAATCRQGDPPIQVSARTSCELAGGFVTKWMNHAPDRPATRSYRVHSPVTGRSYRIKGRSEQRDGYLLVTGRGPHGIWLRFEQW
jgi:hypothetical protein